MTSNTLSPLYFFILLLYAVIMGGSQIIMVKASKQVGQNYLINGALYTLIHSYWLYVAIIFYMLATGFWMAILYKIDIRIAYPIASTAVLFAVIFQSIEQKTLPSGGFWAGVFLVLIGLALIQRGKLSA